MMQLGVPARLSGDFCEQEIDPGLRESFSTVWIHKMPRVNAPPIVVCPDGTIDLQWIDGALRIAGPDIEFKTEVIPASTTVIGFRFRPAAASAWLGISVDELLGKRIMLEDIWGPRARRISEEIVLHGKVSDVIKSMEAALMAYVPRRSTDKIMRDAYRMVETGPPLNASLMPWLARSLSMSERTLRRRFLETIGYGPKTLHRILHYQRFLHLSARSQLPTAILAHQTGYADQAHLVRESKRISGFTPTLLCS
jgi:AraC-like DNA-binding protein